MNPTQSAFADNIRALRFVAHCNVIVDDVSYFDEPFFQDGLVAKKIDEVHAAGRHEGDASLHETKDVLGGRAAGVAGPQDQAGEEDDDLEPGDPPPRDAVLEGVRASRVRRDVAADL